MKKIVLSISFFVSVFAVSNSIFSADVDSAALLKNEKFQGYVDSIDVVDPERAFQNPGLQVYLKSSLSARAPEKRVSVQLNPNYQQTGWLQVFLTSLQNNLPVSVTADAEGRVRLVKISKPE